MKTYPTIRLTAQHRKLLLPLFFGLLVGHSLFRETPCDNLAAQEQTEDSLDRDYAAELPRIPPLSPEEAISSFEVAPGFRLEQVAAEPLVTDPVAMTFAADGSLYVIEMRDYSEHPNDNLGRVRKLIDHDHDGFFDESHVFADRLSWPVAITCFDGGVFVGAPPHLYFLKDSNGDHKADQQDIVLSGFGRSNVQGLMNSLHWTLDHKIHGAVSSSGASLSLTSDSPSPPLVLKGRDFAFDPRTRTLTAASGGGQHGLDFNRWGEKFVCSNSNHLQFVHYEDRYLARNPLFAAQRPTKSIATDGPQADVFRLSPVEPWRIVRTRLRKQGIVPGPVEGGGTPAGYFTGATGVTIYEGGVWPEVEHDWAIIADVGSNLIHRKRLTRFGNSYQGERVDEQSELVRSKDIWFRPVQFAHGPDGGLYVLDMYREVIEHPASLPPLIKKHLDLDHGRERGRIYRLVGEDFQQPEFVDLSKASPEELAGFLEHPNTWTRDTANRLLCEQKPASMVPLLKQFITPEASAIGTIQRLSVLDGLHELEERELQQALRHSSEDVRRFAIRLSENLDDWSFGFRQELMKLSSDESLRVRTQLAFTLGDRPSSDTTQALLAIASRDYKDPTARVAITSALGQGAATFLCGTFRETAISNSETGQQWQRELLGQIFRQELESELPLLLETISKTNAAANHGRGLIIETLDNLPTHAWHEPIHAMMGTDASERRQAMLAEAMQRAQSKEASLEQRTSAIHKLRLGTVEDTLPELVSWLDPIEPIDIQTAALGAILGFRDTDRVADMLIERWGMLSPDIRHQAMDGMLSNRRWTTRILHAMANGKLRLNDVDTSQVQWLRRHPDPELRALAEGLSSVESDRSKVVQAYRPSLSNVGDFDRGLKVFEKHCASCHQVGKLGFAVGPSLAAMKNRGAESILVNVLDPNREINPDFLSYILETVDGQQIAGIVVSETATTITMKLDQGKEMIVLRSDIETFESTGQSLMPEGLEKEITPDQMADLLTFLLGRETNEAP